MPRSLFTTRVARASPSTSSAMIQQLVALLHHLLQHGQDVLDVGNLLVGDQDQGISRSASIFSVSVTM